MLIGSRPKLDLVSDRFSVKVNNIAIEGVTVYESLGMIVGENLTRESPSPAVPFETRQAMYNALILPYFDYSSCVWDNMHRERAGRSLHKRHSESC